MVFVIYIQIKNNQILYSKISNIIYIKVQSRIQQLLYIYIYILQQYQENVRHMMFNFIVKQEEQQNIQKEERKQIEMMMMKQKKKRD
ncbi:unnamed protein product [Paramecium sonneborni]|uniref:Uncharacterized protein n=1 Tax=Paramecium sonneborni TaxID=65129 RepID=A0A8S1QL75_9CILI|nr:unnamed protein product [Paramecium sonneborni]